MASIRLYKALREKLIAHAEDKIRKSMTEEAAEVEEIRRATTRTVKAAVEAVNPPADMAVLAKYDLAMTIQNIRLRIGDRGDRTVLNVELSDAVVMPFKPYAQNSEFRISADTPIEAAARQLLAVEARYAAVVRERCRPYVTLIDGSSTLKQVTDVWPEACEITGPRAEYAIATVTDALKAEIRADMAARGVEVAS